MTAGTAGCHFRRVKDAYPARESINRKEISRQLSFLIAVVLLYNQLPSCRAISKEWAHPSHLRALAPPSDSHFTRFLQHDICKDVTNASNYEWLIERQISPYTTYKLQFDAKTFEMRKDDLSAIVYVKDNQLYLHGKKGRVRTYMLELYLEYLQMLTEKDDLPDLVMVISGEDHPQSRDFPIFSFCRRASSHNDLLLPCPGEDSLWEGLGAPRPSRAGRDDTRSAQVIWFGRPHAWYRDLRRVIAQAGMDYPERVHTGLTDWSALPEWYKDGKEEEWEQFRSDGMPLRLWADHYKYQLNVGGNCASSRLSYQLVSDAAVFMMASDDEEWYTPLLRPYLHYIPVYAVEGSESTSSQEENIIDQLDWADEHPDEIEAIVSRSTEFAETHLRPGTGRDCYTMMLLHAYAQLMKDDIVVPEDAVQWPF